MMIDRGTILLTTNIQMIDHIIFIVIIAIIIIINIITTRGLQLLSDPSLLMIAFAIISPAPLRLPHLRKERVLVWWPSVAQRHDHWLIMMIIFTRAIRTAAIAFPRQHH